MCCVANCMDPAAPPLAHMMGMNGHLIYIEADENFHEHPPPAVVELNGHHLHVEVDEAALVAHDAADEGDHLAQIVQEAGINIAYIPFNNQ